MPLIRFRQLLPILVLFALFVFEIFSTISANADDQSYLNLREGDFPKYVTSIKIDNFFIDNEGRSMIWGAWSVSFIGSDPAIAVWNPAINGSDKGSDLLPAFSIRHLKCHNEVVGDVFDRNLGDKNGDLCSISIYIFEHKAELVILHNNHWETTHYIDLPQEIKFQ